MRCRDDHPTVCSAAVSTDTPLPPHPPLPEWPLSAGTDKVREPTRGTRVAAAALATGAGAVWAVAIPVVLAVTDDVPADSYEPQHRFAFVLLAIGLLGTLPTAAFAVFAVARALRANLLVAAFLAQVPALILFQVLLHSGY